MFTLETEPMAVEDVFELEGVLEERGLLGKVFIAEPLPAELRGGAFMIRLASLRPLSRESADALKAAMAKNAGDILGPDPENRIFIRPANVSRASPCPGIDPGR